MNILYYIISIICNISLVCCIHKYLYYFSDGMRFNKSITYIIYTLGVIVFCILSILKFSLAHCILLFLLCFSLAFLHSMRITHCLISSLTLWLVQCCTGLFLVILSGKTKLHLFAAPSFNVIIGKILFLTIVWVFLLFLGFISEYFHKNEPNLFTWIPRFCLPLSLISIASVSLLLDINRSQRSFNFYKFKFLSDVDNPDLLFFLSCTGLLLLNILTIYLCDRILHLKNLQNERNIIFEQNQYFRNQFTLLNSSSKQIHRLRHDMRNHLAALRSIVSTQNKQAVEYLDILLGDFNIKQEISSTGNILIDSLVNYKFRNYLAEKLEISYEASIPENLQYNSWDLTVILGNLIDNAIEATIKCPENNRKITLTIVYKRKCLIIKIKNTFNGYLKKHNGFFSTSKANSDAHGFGLINIQETVEKCGGSFSFGQKDDSFFAMVILNL